MLRRVALVRINFLEEYRLHHQGDNKRAGEVSSNYQPKHANVVPSSLIPVVLMMEATRASEKSVLTRLARRNIPEDCVLHSHRLENLKSYAQ
jgi:hypothetical protein